MSDESQSRDWQLAERLPACTGGNGNVTDGPQFAAKKTSESDVRQFSNISTVADVESSVHDNSNRCEDSDATESSQLHNCCMLSGIDVSSVNSDSNISIQSADVSAGTELNDARLSAADGDSSINSTLKGSEVDEASSKHSTAEINTSQPTLAVSIPISNVFEMETKEDKNADVKSSGDQCSSEPVREAYSPISDVGEETTRCQTPEPSAPPVYKRSTMREFSPISPFTPRPSAPGSPLPVVPLYWSLSAAAAGDASAWSSSASLAESADSDKKRQQHSDVMVSHAHNFSPMHQLLYSHQSKLSCGDLTKPMDVNAPAGHCQNVSFEQQHHAGVVSRQAYQPPENRYLSPHRWYHSQQPYMHRANTVGSSIATQSLYSANSQRPVASQLSSVEAGQYNATAPTTSVWDGNMMRESNGFGVASRPDIRSASNVGHRPSAASHGHADSCNDANRLPIRRLNANTSISGNGQFMYLLSLLTTFILNLVVTNALSLTYLQLYCR